MPMRPFVPLHYCSYLQVLIHLVGLSILFCSFACCFLLAGTHRVHSTLPTDIQVLTNIQDESGAITESGIPLYMSLKSMCKNFSIISACTNLLVVIQILSHSYNISSFANPMLEELLHSQVSHRKKGYAIIACLVLCVDLTIWVFCIQNAWGS